MYELEYLAQFIDAHRSFYDHLSGIMIQMQMEREANPRLAHSAEHRRRFRKLHHEIDRVSQRLNRQIQRYQNVYRNVRDDPKAQKGGTYHGKFAPRHPRIETTREHHY